MPKYRDEDIALTEYIENEVIAGVRNDLEDQFEKFAEDTRASLMDIVKRRFKRTYQKFHDQGRALISRKSSRSAQSTQQTVAQTLEATFPDVNFDSLAEFDVDYPDSNLQFDFINGLDFPSQISDSAYGSMGSPFRA